MNKVGRQVIFFVLAISLFIGTVSSIQGWSPNFILAQHHRHVYSANPSLGIDSKNNTHVIWTKKYSNKEGLQIREIQYTKLDNHGRTLIDDISLASGWYCWYSSMAIDSSDNVHVVAGDNYVKLDENGNKLIVNEIGLGLGLRPVSSDVDSSDNVHIVAGDNYVKLDNNGSELINKTLTMLTDGKDMAMAIDSQDNVHIVWSARIGLNNYEIYYTKLNNSGSTLIEGKRLTDNTRGSYDPSIAIDSQDNVHVGWSEDIPDVVHYVKLDNNGSELIKNPNVAVTSLLAEQLSMAIDSNGNVHVTWKGKGIKDGFSEIYYTKLDNNGNVSLTDVDISGTVSPSSSPAIATDSNSNVHVTWV